MNPGFRHARNRPERDPDGAARRNRPQRLGFLRADRSRRGRPSLVRLPSALACEARARVVSLALETGIGKDDDPAFLTPFGLYAVLSLWAFSESPMVLHRRMHTRRAAADRAESNEPKIAADAGPVRSGALRD